MIELIPHVCPNCSTPLTIIRGKGENVLKLFCPNDKCSGSILKKLSKAVSILNVKNIGPAKIERLYNVGIQSIVDLFDKSIINEENLIKSGEFKKGRELNIVINSINSIVEISMEKAINSLQLEVEKESGDGYISIGKSLSLQIANMLSDISYDFQGLSKQVRNDLESSDSKLLKIIKNDFERFEKNGVKIKPLEIKKVFKKKISKRVSFETKEDYKSILEKLNWEEVDVLDSDMLIVDDDKIETKKIKTAKENAVTIISMDELKLLFL